ncbi:hypothetical protein H5V45_12870 [Nocardioides sp. KIGAM211]|uniref:Uncharacterized protein n=1 Tax=Nocardioides luti TaxID=2761101 RepID=A0A7X0VAW5_9ACTN|nr:hypothetical protein [Nocardioides luti]MBB6628214.1 hypothetical protein [Nocardioides luti]
MRRHLWWVLGLVLVVAGIVVALSVGPGPGDDVYYLTERPPTRPDWFTGFSQADTSGSLVFLSRGQLAGCALAVLGLLVVAAGLGFRMGRRRAGVGR